MSDSGFSPQLYWEKRYINGRNSGAGSYGRLAEYKSTKKYDLSMSLDVIYHLIEDAVFDSYMHRLSAASKRFVLIYASDFDAPGPAVHVRHRNFSNWIAQHKPGWECVDAPEHPYPMIEGSNPNKTSFASFKLFECSK